MLLLHMLLSFVSIDFDLNTFTTLSKHLQMEYQMYYSSFYALFTPLFRDIEGIAC